MLRKLIRVAMALAAIAMSSCAPSFAAKPHLVAAWPRAGASLSVYRHTFDLTFNRPLNAEASSAAVWRDEDGATMPTDVTFDPASPGRLRVRLLEPAVGDYQLHWHAVAAQSNAAADGDHAFSLQDESTAPPRIEVSPATADKGDKLELVGNGFTRQSAVQLTIADDEQPLGSVEADARGKFNVELSVPPSVPLGTQPVVATDSAGRSASTAVQVRWGGWPPVVGTTVGQPGPEPGEVTLTVNVRNGSDYIVEHVRIVLKDPQGGLLVGADPVPQRGDGELTWTIPIMDRGELGPFRAIYRSKNAVVGKAWFEFRHRHTGSCTRDDCMPAFISDSSAESQLTAPAE
jgi:methionine-rich copper-binding protein CopC